MFVWRSKIPENRLRSRIARIAVFIAFSLLGASLVSVDWVGVGADSATVLEVQPRDLDLGEVWLQQELDFQIPIQNPGDVAVAVGRLTASCNCVQLRPTSFTVPPNGQVVVRGTIDLTKSVDNEAEAKERFEVVVSAQTSNPHESIFTWPLRGVAMRVLNVWPPSVSLYGANEVVAGTFAPTVMLTIAPKVPIADLKPEWFQDEADLNLSGPADDGTYSLSYTPSVDQRVGEIDTRVTLSSKLTDGAVGPDVRIPVRGNVVPPVRLSPSRLVVREGTMADELFGSQSPVARIVSLNKETWSVVETASSTVPLDWDFSVPGKIRVTTKTAAVEKVDVGFVLRSESGRTANAELEVNFIAEQP